MISNKYSTHTYTNNKRRCVIDMMCKKKCRGPNKSVGFFFIAIGLGLFLAYILPYYLLICLLGLGLICAGVSFIMKK